MKMRLDKNVLVEIPKEATVVPSTGRVQITIGSTVDQSGRTRPRLLVIGKCVSGTTQMYPNDNFIEKYPREYDKVAHTHTDANQKSIGLYAGMMSVGESYGIYDVLQTAYGLENGNVIVDFSMFSILTRLNVAEIYSVEMREHVMFSGEVKSDEWISSFLQNKLTNEN